MGQLFRVKTEATKPTNIMKTLRNVIRQWQTDDHAAIHC